MTGYEELKLIDSNILVYSYDKSEQKKHQKAKEIVKQAWIKKDAVLSMQNLAEFYSIITRKTKKPMPLDTAKQIILDLIDGFEILRYDENSIINAINNQAIYKIPFWDSLIVSVMEENSIDSIITENEKDFKKVKWLKVINPFK
jgi:predicted nucleic acid-binding protein